MCEYINKGSTSRVSTCKGMAPELDGCQDKGPWSDSRVIKCA
jgi:hypothetical protein